MTNALHITLAQINPAVGDLAGNRERIARALKDAPGNADLVIFPELAVCGYPPEDLVLKPFFLAQVEKTVDAIAALTKDSAAHLLLSAPHRQDGKTYNAVHLIGGGKIIETRFKNNLPNYGVFDEQRVFKSGPLPDPIMFKGHRLGVMICEDMWTPDVSTHLADNGAEMLIVVNASPFEAAKNARRLDLARQRVKETGLPLIYVNQCGGQDELVFDGASFVLSEQGRLILQAEEFVEDIHHTVWEKSPGGKHWLCSTDNVTPTHEGADAIYQAVMIGLRDYMSKNGFPGAIIGLSGGIDSALAAVLAVDALGPEAVHCVMMPSQYTSQESLEDAAAIAKNLGVHLDDISIERAVTAFEKELAPHFTHDTPSITHENIQPRCRGLILMALSNATGRMVLSTGNKSEMAVGYATLYGDMCGGFNPLKDLYKTQVYELSRFRNAHKPDHAWGPRGVLIPENVLTRAPTAELKADQTDQDTLPPYDVLDGILAALIEEDLGIDDIVAKGFDRDTVKRVWRMLDIAEYKRRQAPPGVKITSRAFGRDRRYPITNRFSGMITR